MARPAARARAAAAAEAALPLKDISATSVGAPTHDCWRGCVEISLLGARGRGLGAVPALLAASTVEVPRPGFAFL